jgi:1-phosphatidylinositol-3-phosphate 5-kinase
LEVLFEQESKYMEILVSRILKIRPNILLVGKSVIRKAQELLIKAGIILIQHVKVSLLSRIARQMGASILPSMEHILMNHHAFGENVLGRCRRFRLVTYRDNEAWSDSPSVL